MTKLRQSGDYQMPVVDRGVRPGTVLRIVLLAIVLTVSAIAFVIFKNEMENEIVLGILGVLAMVGIFFLVSSVIGFIEVMPQSRPDELARAFLDAHEDGTIVTDRKGRIIYANAAYGALTGAKSAAGIQSLETILSRNREATEAIYRLTNGLHEGKQGHEEFRLLKPLATSTSSGSGAHWFRLKARVLPLEDSERNPLYLWQIADITAERDDQERFFKELQNAIDYLDHAPAGFFSAGRKGEIFYINATLADWLGIDLTKFQPGSISIGDLVAGEGLTLVQAVQAEPGLKKTKMLDLDLRKLNGQSLPVRMIHRVSSTRDGAPGESRTIVMSREGGEDNEQSASSAAMRFTRFFNNTPMAIASVDGNGRILRTNAPFLKLFSGLVSQDDVERGALIEAVVHETEKGRLHEALAAAKDRQGDIAPIDALHPKDGERHFRFYINAVIDQSDQSPEEAAIIHALEITEQKALENQMAQTQKMNAVGTLAGGIAHDFNNILAAILGNVAVARHDAASGLATDASLAQIERSAVRARALVQQILTFSRMQAQELRTQALQPMIEETLAMLRAALPAQVELAVALAAEPVWVRADATQMQQVVMNLCTNAWHALPAARGRIDVGLDTAPDPQGAPQARLWVADDGSGMDDATLARIFEPFFTTKQVGHGTGLGLAVVHGIVSVHGGTIRVESAPGVGTRFELRFPLQPAPPAEPAQPAPAAPAPRGAGQCVLCVDDDPAMVLMMQALLQRSGYAVRPFEHPLAALAAANEPGAGVDVVVSDYNMPEMNGMELAEAVRRVLPGVPVVITSGFISDEMRQQAQALGVALLQKEYTLERLPGLVHAVLGAGEGAGLRPVPVCDPPAP